ncbi:MAG TPA: hypothetical protein VMW55_04955 [Nitrosopumilaceae archaeon]|nr:hypothetical protein [Nitrosopumilaceae archaeon]
MVVEKMQTRELTLVLIIMGYPAAVFTFFVIERKIKFQDYGPKPLQMVKLFGNGRVRNFEIDNPAPDPNLFTIIAIAFLRLAYALPFAIAGIGLVGAPVGFL